MIELRNLTKVFRLYGRRKTVADNISCTFPTGASVGLLGRNGAGKSTLLKLIAGTTHPTSGSVFSTGSVSFPVGLASALHPDLTGAQNTRFVARIYGADTDALMGYVEEFAELGDHFHLPVRSYSSGMRGRLSFGINMGLKFDTYLIDEITAVGDAAFKRKSRDVFLDRMKDAGAVFVSHSMGTIREMCTSGAYLEDGKLQYFEDVEEAVERYAHSLDANTSHLMPGAPGDSALIDFPFDARMLFGLGLSQTRFDWMSDCLRRHRPCHFPKTREPHYFDTREGLFEAIPKKRLQIVETLAQRMQIETDEARRTTLGLLGDMSELAAIHTAPSDGADRHQAYITYLLDRRKSQPIVCDFTPGYARLSETTLREMAQIGSARFVVVLRDPARRLWQQIWEDLPPKRRTFKAALDAAHDVLTNPEGLAAYPESDYAALIAKLEATIDPERICWLLHERLTGRDGLRVLSDFLDIPNVPSFKLPDQPQSNCPDIPPEVETALRMRLAPQYAAAQARFGRDIQELWAPSTVYDPNSAAQTVMEPLS